MTEDEAKTKWCPFARHIEQQDYISPADGSKWERAVVVTNTGARCIGSACMAWRWTGKDFGRDATGFCGLAGRPS